MFSVKKRTIGAGTPQICSPLVGKTIDELMAEAHEVIRVKPDIVEWRADYLHNVAQGENCLKALEHISAAINEFPLIFTLRIHTEGGQQQLEPSKRLELITQAIETGTVDIVDVEYANDTAFIKQVAAVAQKNNVRLIISSHYFDGTPSQEQMVQQLINAQNAGADIAKLAVMPATTEDVLNLLGATNTFHAKHAKIPAVTMSMAALGVISRIAGGIFGSSITFGSLREASAPGQMSVRDLQTAIGLLKE